ncbi:MAG: hypothetical protein HQ559_09405 [Lentisphaerae bacterium]|nr:hypothetical protein [Lentisphaerota bacterium]
MSQEPELFGKTFDQQVMAAGKDILARDITPNRRIPAEIIFEPTGSRVRVTAFDKEGHVLFQRDVKKTEGNADPRRVSGEVVFEPMATGMRVTARDSDHKVLWGYVGAKETLPQIHCLVAIYDTLQSLLEEELEKRGLIVADERDPLEEAKRRLSDLQDTLDKLRDCILVQKRGDATDSRARTIARLAADANKLVNLELASLGPMPGVSKDRAVEIAQRHCAQSTLEFGDGAPPAEWEKKTRAEWKKKCWFITANTTRQRSADAPRIVGVAKKDGEILLDTDRNDH